MGMGLPPVLSLIAGADLCGMAAPIADHLFNEPGRASLLRWVSHVIPFQALRRVAGAATCSGGGQAGRQPYKYRGGRSTIRSERSSAHVYFRTHG